MTVLPYGGTSGWSGSSTSEERAIRADEGGKTGLMQDMARRLLADKGPIGATWREFAAYAGVHHGTASGTLSCLHKEGEIARLEDRRDRCQIYVLPEHVGDRVALSHGRKRPTLEPAEDARLRRVKANLAASPDRERFDGVPRTVLEDLVSIIERLR